MSLSLTALLRAGPLPATAQPAPVAPPGVTRPFGEYLRPAVGSPAIAPPAALVAPAAAPVQIPLASQLLQRVARGERQVESLVRQAVSGRSFTPQELLVVQAQVYRYTQELDLLGKLIDKGTSTVRTVLTQSG